MRGGVHAQSKRRGGADYLQRSFPERALYQVPLLVHEPAVVERGALLDDPGEPLALQGGLSERVQRLVAEFGQLLLLLLCEQVVDRLAYALRARLGVLLGAQEHQRLLLPVQGVLDDPHLRDGAAPCELLIGPLVVRGAIEHDPPLQPHRPVVALHELRAEPLGYVSRVTDCRAERHYLRAAADPPQLGYQHLERRAPPGVVEHVYLVEHDAAYLVQP